MSEHTFKGPVYLHIGSAAKWAANNITPHKGELCCELDTRRLKIGDGVTPWNSLSYILGATVATRAPSAADVVVNVGDIWIDTAGQQLHYCVANNGSASTWKRNLTLEDLSALGDMRKADYASNGTVGKVDKSVTADRLAAARAIAGSAFDGTANIDVSYSSLTNKPTIPSLNNTLASTSTAEALTAAQGKALKDGLDGKAPTAHATTATTYGVGSASNYGHVKASTASPLVAGTAAVGADDGTYARGNHVHPSQSVPAASSTTPKSPGTAAAGSETAYARGDHVHPSQSVPGASSVTPSAPGTAAVGTSSAYARADHVHAEQTSIAGNAATATRLLNARTISLSGAVTGSVSFNGTGNAAITTTADDFVGKTTEITASTAPVLVSNMTYFCRNTSDITITIGLNGMNTTPIDCEVMRLGTGNVTIAADGASLFSVLGSKTSYKIPDQYGVAAIKRVGINAYVITGDLE